MNGINQSFTHIETRFNQFNTIPVLGIPGGYVRAILGKIQATAGAIIGMVGLAGMLVNQDDLRWRKISQLGAEHLIHGVLNIMRGFSEAVVGVVGLGLAGVGSLFLIIPNMCQRDSFSPTFKYGSLTS
jgi:hypothetical protein